MQTINLHPASNDPRLPEWARGILPEPPKNVDVSALTCASASRILSIFEMTGEPEFNERLHEAVNDLNDLDLHSMDQTSFICWLHVVGWVLTNHDFTIPRNQTEQLVDKYHESCLRMSMTPLRGGPGLIIPTAVFDRKKLS